MQNSSACRLSVVFALLNANHRYNDRLYGLLRDFGARFSDVDAIHRQAIAAERLRVQPQWWKQLWAKFWSRFASESARILEFMSSLDNNQVINMTSEALGGMLAAHSRFKEQPELNGAAATSVQRNRIKERRQLNCAAPAATRQMETLVLRAVGNPQNNLAASTAAAITAHSNDPAGQSMSQVQTLVDVEEARAADVNRTDAAFKSRHRHRAELFELKEIVVHDASAPVLQELNTRSLNASNAVSTANPKRSADQQLQHITTQLAEPSKDATTESESREKLPNSRARFTADNGGWHRKSA